MARLTSLLTLFVGVILLLLPMAQASTEVKKGDRLRFYRFIDDFCNNQPSGGNIDLRDGDCSNKIDARSFTAMIDETRHRWLDGVNHGTTKCYLAVFEEPNCPKGRERDLLRLPAEISRCYTSAVAIKSVRWYCEDVDGAMTKPKSTITTTFLFTSWSIHGDQPLTPITGTKTATLTASFFQAKAALQSPEPEIRDASTQDGQIPVSGGIWLYHPWARSPICYHCYMKDSDDYTSFECRSGAKDAKQCGPRPLADDGGPLTTTVSPTATVTVIDPNHTETVTVRRPLEARGSWHRRVSFDHPFMAGHKACADAEWEKRGQAKSEIRLQKAKVIKSDTECPDADSLNLPSPVIKGGPTSTVYVSARTRTVTMIMSGTSTSSLKAKHEDL